MIQMHLSTKQKPRWKNTLEPAELQEEWGRDEAGSWVSRCRPAYCRLDKPHGPLYSARSYIQ